MDPGDLRELVAALKHDLGKYVAWRSTNLDFPDEGLDADHVEAFQADILRTRSGRDGTVLTAWDVWDRATPQLPRTLGPELHAVGDAVSVLRELSQPLERGNPVELADHCAAIRAAQNEIRSQLSALHRRLSREA